MGTGGGEFLASLSPHPPLTYATEGYPPNFPIAEARLRPLGIQVRPLDEEDPGILPFDDDMFDLVINRHEYYDPAEVWRVLHPGGRFITQQVGGEDHADLNRLLAAPEPDNGYAFWTLAYARDQLAAVGFVIGLADEAFPIARFTDAGALAYYLRAIEWQIPDFDVERYFPRLREIHRRCREEGGIASREHRFILVAERPAE
jgi:SAM-dependent methyltransferase